MKNRCLLFILLLLLSGKIAAQDILCPPNIDFEEGTLNSWKFYTGTCCPISTPTLSGPLRRRHELTSGTAIDTFGLFPIVSPTDGRYSLKLGNDSNGKEAERARYYIRVPATLNASYVLVYRYAVVFQDPGHLPVEQPRFTVQAFDSLTNATISCTEYSYVASKTLPGFQSSPTPLGIAQGVVYKDWTTASIDLSTAKGKTVAIDFASGDCSLGGHFGYGYVDLSCGLFTTRIETCKGGDSVLLVAPPGFMRYDWFDSSFRTPFGSGITKLIQGPIKTAKYAVVITPYPGYGCPDTLYTLVSTEFYKAFALPDTNICLAPGQSTLLQLNAKVMGTKAPFKYKWSPATGLSCATCDNPTVTINKNFRIGLTITDSTNCERYDSAIINVYETVTANISLPQDTICQYAPITLTNNYPHKYGFYYGWLTDTAKVSAQDSSGFITMHWNTDGLKKVVLKATNYIKCESDDSVYVFVKPSAVAEFDMKDVGCLDREVTITPKVTLPATYHWTITEQTLNDTVYVPQYTFKWHTIGQKVVTLNVVSANGCSPPTDTQTIYINENPPAHIQVANGERICFGDEITLNTPKGTDFVYAWGPPEYFKNNNYYEAQMLVERSTTVLLSVSNRWGCTTADSIPIKAGLCCKIFMPDAFSPNKDGHNDNYNAVGAENQTIHTFLIKDRWGQTMFTSQDSREGWNGNFKHTPQPMGTYFYYIKYLCDDGNTYEKKGSFVLLR